jgi:DNA-binding response OmpR family regulator
LNGRVGGLGHPLLVIEDEAKLAALLSRSLTASGYEVTSVGEGSRGLELAQEGRFALIILDLLLPDIDGFAVLDALLQKWPNQAVLVVSALSDVGSKVRCLEFGAVDYLAKPFELPELIARVRRHVRSGQDETAGVLDVGNVSLDLRRHRASISDRPPAPLSTREFVLLEFLMRREGDVCARAELLEHVWGYSFDPGTNVLEVYVGRLRHKLGHGVIETVRNVGYSFLGA